MSRLASKQQWRPRSIHDNFQLDGVRQTLAATNMILNSNYDTYDALNQETSMKKRKLKRNYDEQMPSLYHTTLSMSYDPHTCPISPTRPTGAEPPVSLLLVIEDICSWFWVLDYPDETEVAWCAGVARGKSTWSKLEVRVLDTSCVGSSIQTHTVTSCGLY
jgi:hypothetical protein